MQELYATYCKVISIFAVVHIIDAIISWIIGGAWQHPKAGLFMTSFVPLKSSDRTDKI